MTRVNGVPAVGAPVDGDTEKDASREAATVTGPPRVLGLLQES
jgi:hypothetical protein